MPLPEPLLSCDAGTSENTLSCRAVLTGVAGATASGTGVTLAAGAGVATTGAGAAGVGVATGAVAVRTGAVVVRVATGAGPPPGARR
jgi:hypothetical protein